MVKNLPEMQGWSEEFIDRGALRAIDHVLTKCQTGEGLSTHTHTHTHIYLFITLNFSHSFFWSKLRHRSRRIQLMSHVICRDTTVEWF